MAPVLVCCSSGQPGKLPSLLTGLTGGSWLGSNFTGDIFDLGRVREVRNGPVQLLNF